MAQETENKLFLAFQKQIEKVNYFCTVENVSPNLAVHEIRKSFKRMRAFLKFFKESSNINIKECKRQLVMQGKSIALLRESYVNIQVFDRITSENNIISERRKKAIKEKFIENNRLLLDKDFFESKCQIAILDLMKQLENQMGTEKSTRILKNQVQAKLNNAFFKCYTFYQNLNPEFDSEELHYLRKKIKVLYYQMDFAKFIHPKYFKLKSDQLHKITEQLGQDHDLYVFLNEAKSGIYSFTEQELEILKNQVHHLRELILHKLRLRLKQLFCDSPEIFNQKVEEILKESFG